MGKTESEVQHRHFFRRFLSFLASFRNTTRVPDSSPDSLRETRSGLPGTFPEDTGSVSDRLPGLGKAGISGRMDAELPESIPTLDKMTQKIQKSRDEIFAEGHFEWIKTERAGDVSKFARFERGENGIEWVVFQDNTRVNSALIGDVVLMHQYENEILGGAATSPTAEENVVHSAADYSRLTAGLEDAVVHQPNNLSNVYAKNEATDPVNAIFEKTKKRNEKLTLTIQVKIPAPEVYSVIRDNFENVDDILIQNVISQIEGKALREAVKASLLAIYSKKKTPKSGPINS